MTEHIPAFCKQVLDNIARQVYGPGVDLAKYQLQDLVTQVRRLKLQRDTLRTDRDRVVAQVRLVTSERDAIQSAHADLEIEVKSLRLQIEQRNRDVAELIDSRWDLTP